MARIDPPTEKKLDSRLVYVFNTGGYRATPFVIGAKGHYELGGFSDATFPV